MNRNTLIFRAAQPLFIAVVLAILAGTTSCSENALTLGSDLIPQGDNAIVASFDGSSLSLRTQTGDTVRTDHGYLRSMGSHFDPIFGVSQADLLMEITPEKKHLGTGISADSMILYIQIDSIYGKPTDSLTLQLFRMNTPLDDSLEYYSTTNPDLFFSPSDLLLETAVSVSDTLLRLKIDDVLLLSQLTALDSANMGSATFKQLLPGFLFRFSRSEPDATGAILYPSVRSTSMRLYYKNNASSDLTWYFYPRIVVSCYRFNREESVIAPYLDQEEPATEMAFIQGLSGADLLVNLDDAGRWLDSMSTSGMVISKAELILTPKEMSHMGLYWTQYPKRLTLFYYENDVESTVMQSPAGGGYIRERNAYVFNLNLHFARFLKGTVTATQFRIVPYYEEDNTYGSDVLNRLYDARRVVFDPSASGVKIYYTKPF